MVKRSTIAKPYSRWLAAALGVGALLVTLGLSTTPPTAEAQGLGRIPGQYIVVFKDDVSNPAAKALEKARQHGLGVFYTYEVALKGFAAVVPEGRLQALLNDPDVKYVEQDQVVSAIHTSGSNPDPEVPTGVHRIGWHDSSQSSGVAVAVIDTGSGPHSDLNVVGGVNFATWDGTKSHDHSDKNGHGTHVAGTVAAKSGNGDVVGVAPGTGILSVRVLDRRGSGTTSSVVKGMDWVIGRAKVANMSLGGGDSPAMKEAAAKGAAAGVVFVVAAGNSGTHAGNTSPANSPDVICVAALADSDGHPGGKGSATQYGADDTCASFSNWGTDVVDIGAPGVNIRSTRKGGGTTTMSGTSMASPHVAGVAALYCKSNSGATWSEVLSGIKSTEVITGPGGTYTMVSSAGK